MPASVWLLDLKIYVCFTQEHLSTHPLVYKMASQGCEGHTAMLPRIAVEDPDFLQVLGCMIPFSGDVQVDESASHVFMFSI